MEPLLANLFPNADRNAWLAQVQKELKSEDAYESLRWHTDDGFRLEPYYTSDSLTNLRLNRIQAAQKPTAGWLNTPEYRITDEKATNAILRNVLTQGADALLLNLSAYPVDVPQLLNGIKLSDTPVFFRLNSDPESLAGLQPAQANFLQTLRNVAPYQLKGGLLMDVSDVTVEATRLTATSPLFRTICVSSHGFHNAGATAVQELAFTLASLADAYDTLTDSGLLIDQLIPKTMLSISVGASYFLEIAKLRALRVLLNRFLTAYTPSFASGFYIHTQTSTFYDAAVTPYINLIRATTEAMAAVMGGCDALTVHPYDAVLNIPNEPSDREFSERIARNVSILLNEESYLGQVADPSAGSYYVENLTHQLIDTTWALFLDVERRGGLSKALTDGFIQREIDRAYQTKVQAVRAGNVLVGVTKFRSDEVTSQKQVISPDKDFLPVRRLAEEFE